MLSSAARRISSGPAPVEAAFSATAALNFSIVAWVGSRPTFSSSSSATGQFGRSQLGPASRSIIPTASFMLRCNQQLPQRLAQLRWARGHGNSSLLQRRDLSFGLSLAAGADRRGMAHAAAWWRGASGDDPSDRLVTPAFRFVGEKLRGILLGAAADLADHDDRAGFVVGEEHLEHVDELGAFDRIAADADSGRLPQALVGRLEHRFIGQRARAADDPDAALLEDVGGHDPDLTLFGRQNAGAIWPDQPRFGTTQSAFDPDHVEHWNALGDGDDKRHFGVDRLEDRIRGERRRDIDKGRGTAPFLDGFVNGVEHGEPEGGRAALRRRHPADHLRPVVQRLLGVERPGFTGHSLGDDPGVPIDEDTHARLPSICLQATSSSFTASTLTLKFSRAASSSSISTIRSTPPPPATHGTPT